jgi:hypothetical protein
MSDHRRGELVDLVTDELRRQNPDRSHGFVESGWAEVGGGRRRRWYRVKNAS